MAYEILPPIEAGSLSAITSIAANPPQHPTIPVESVTQPLVLYIARVPGSRDVFLTPIKPRDRVVTAEDVQSSLYYVHINCEDDREVLEPRKLPTIDTTHCNSDSQSETGSIRRRPVSPSKSPSDDSSHYRTADLQSGFGAKTRPVLPSRPLSTSSPSYVAPQPHMIERRPVSPSKSPRIARKPVFSDITNGNVDLPFIPRRPLPTPPDEEPDLRSFDPIRPPPRTSRSYEATAPSPPVSLHPTPGETGSLTLIRRDPGTASQWNVASIHDPPTLEVSSAALLSPHSAASRIRKGGAPLYLDISNPGYGIFIDRERPESRVSTSTSSSDSSAEAPPEGTFRRRLYMPGSRGRRGYSFTSPWEGKCEFATGGAGRSLKCRHTLTRQPVTDISELRFNLPTTTAAPTPTAQKRSSYFSHRRHASEGFEDGTHVVINEDGRVDLSLGAEKAGGGFGGRQAKLGKLIVEVEGLKMLDLVVAANVGLWWRAWERV